MSTNESINYVVTSPLNQVFDKPDEKEQYYINNYHITLVVLKEALFLCRPPSFIEM